MCTGRPGLAASPSTPRIPRCVSPICPPGLVVICQDQKSQHKNKAKALTVLRARLYDMELRQQQDEMSEKRKNQVGSGDRSGRIRTYNFPQGRMTDHRIGLTLYKLDSVMQGDIREIIDSPVNVLSGSGVKKCRFRIRCLKKSAAPAIDPQWTILKNPSVDHVFFYHPTPLTAPG